MTEGDGQGNEIARYSYDPFGRRIRKTTNQTGTVSYLYSPDGVIAETDEAGTTTTTYGWVPNGIWGTAPQWKADVTVTGGSSAAAQTYHYYHNDHLGTPQRLTNDQGVLTWSALMESFGRTITIDTIVNQTINNQPQAVLMPTITMNNLRFAGQMADAETNTYYNFFRDYDPVTGRYLQSDPIGLAGGVNWYGYVLARPSQYIDPYGTCVSEGAIKIIAGALGGAVTGGILFGVPGVFGGLVVGGGAEYLKQEIPEDWKILGLMAVGAVAGLALGGSSRGAAVGAIAGAYTGGLEATQNPGMFQNAAANGLGGFVGGVAAEALIRPPRFAPSQRAIFGPVRGGFAGFLGGAVQDLTEGGLTHYFACR